MGWCRRLLGCIWEYVRKTGCLKQNAQQEDESEVWSVCPKENWKKWFALRCDWSLSNAIMDL